VLARVGLNADSNAASLDFAAINGDVFGIKR
jgi:hypothetical protein